MAKRTTKIFCFGVSTAFLSNITYSITKAKRLMKVIRLSAWNSLDVTNKILKF